jgi:opacity protein-like surface antigen
MKVKNLSKQISTLLTIAFACNANANTTDYNYIGASAGIAFPTNIGGNSELKNTSGRTASNLGTSIGRKMIDRFGVEVEYSYRNKSDISNAGTNSVSNNWGVSANTIMLNLTADLLKHEMIRPYIKGGFGLSINKANNYININNQATNTWSSKSTRSFAWQVALGLNFTTFKNIDTNFEYAFVNRGKFKTANCPTYITSQINESTNDSARIGYLTEQVISIGFKIKF